MTTSRFTAAVGLALGAVWGIAGFGWAVLTLVLGVVGFLVGQVLEGRVDVTEYLGHRHRG